MSALLKDIYSPSFFSKFAAVVADVMPSFNKKQFTQLIYDKDWENKELKQRMKHISQSLHRFLPGEYEKAVKIMEQIFHQLRQRKITESSLEFMFFPDYIESFGLDHFNASVRSIEFVTQFTSCEFAVRPFIIRYGDKMLKQMTAWSLHDNHHVRRLASEGSRPRLPWAIAIPQLKKDPSPVLPLLENLKRDPSEYVRRSVANNLNDIAKDHPHIVISIAKKWRGIGKETDAIIRHGCRTLLKQAHPEILNYYGLGDNDNIRVSAFKILTPVVKMGRALEFSFMIHCRENKPQTIRLEYAVYFLKKNGQLSKKVFKISERQFQPGETSIIHRKQSFKQITTRVYYPGQHQVAVIINGKEQKPGKFELIT